jgi:hypothetical protein
MAKYFGTPHTLQLGGTICVISSILFLSKLQLIKNMIRPIYVRLGIMPEEVSSGVQAATENTIPSGE